MGRAEVEAILSEVAKGLQTQTRQLTDALVERYRIEVPELWEYEDLAAVMPVSLTEHIVLGQDILRRGLDVKVGEIKMPPAGIEVARLFAVHGRSASELTRVYGLGYASMVQLLLPAVSRLTSDPDLIKEAEIALLEFCYRLNDFCIEQALAAYQEERDLRLQRRLMVINEAGTRIGTTL